MLLENLNAGGCRQFVRILQRRRCYMRDRIKASFSKKAGTDFRDGFQVVFAITHILRDCLGTMTESLGRTWVMADPEKSASYRARLQENFRKVER